MMKETLIKIIMENREIIISGASGFLIKYVLDLIEIKEKILGSKPIREQIEALVIKTNDVLEDGEITATERKEMIIEAKKLYDLVKRRQLK